MSLQISSIVSHSLWALPTFYFILLHPIFSNLGGILFFLFGWIIPTVWYFNLALWIVVRFGREITRAYRAISVFMLSLLLSLVLPFSHWFFAKTAKPILVDVKRIEPVSMGFHNAETIAGFQIQSNKFANNIRLNSFDLPSVSGDEGCGCLYFRAPRVAEDTVGTHIKSLPNYRRSQYRQSSKFSEILVRFFVDTHHSHQITVSVYKLGTTFTSEINLDAEDAKSVLVLSNLPGYYQYSFDPNLERDRPFSAGFLQTNGSSLYAQQSLFSACVRADAL